MQYYIHSVIFLIAGGGIISWYYIDQKNKSTYSDEPIKTFNYSLKIEEVNTPSIQNVLQKQLTNSKEQINSYIATSDQTKLQDTNKIISQINASKLDFEQKEQTLNHWRNEYRMQLFNSIQHIINLGSWGYVRIHDYDQKKFIDIYGNNINYIKRLFSHIGIYHQHKNNVYDWPVVNLNQTYYSYIPSEFNFQITHYHGSRYKGFAIFHNEKIAWSFIDINDSQRIRDIGKELETTVNKLKESIEEYKKLIKQQCDMPIIFGYSDVATCINKIYEPIKNMNY